MAEEDDSEHLERRELLCKIDELRQLGYCIPHSSCNLSLDDLRREVFRRFEVIHASQTAERGRVIAEGLDSLGLITDAAMHGAAAELGLDNDTAVAEIAKIRQGRAGHVGVAILLAIPLCCSDANVHPGAL
jgi:hypothetical protein